MELSERYQLICIKVAHSCHLIGSPKRFKTQYVCFVVRSFEKPRFVKKVQGLAILTGWKMLTKLEIEILLDFGNINISHNVRNTRTSTCHREHACCSLSIRHCFLHPSMSRNASQKHGFSPFHRKHNTN